MNIRNIIVSLILAAACSSVMDAQSLHKQELSKNFGLPSPQPKETLPVSSVPVAMPQKAERKPAVSVLKPVSDNVWEITSGWKLYEGDKVLTDEWYNAVVPGTVLTTLVQQGVYPDPKFGLNNLAIPDDLCRKVYEDRYGFPAVQSVPPHDRHRKHHCGPHSHFGAE